MWLLDKIRRLVTSRSVPRQIPVYIPILQSQLMKGRSALITGGTRGIGFAIAESFLRAGATVVIAGRNKEKVNEAVEQLRQRGGQISGIEMDVTKTEQFDGLLDAIAPFDILVNNAGFVGGSGFGNTAEEDYDAIMDTNLKGAYFLSQSVAKRWIRDGVKGNILNVCSASSLRPGDSPYILSKWGLRTLTVGMAKQLIKHGIVVNGLAPGVTNTDKFANGDDDISKPGNPSGRMLTKEEVGNMAVVLTSPLCRMVVGDILYMTGGGAIVTLND